MCRCCDSQEVGLEAAILERERNSSLVKWFRADNVAGLKHTAEAAAPSVWGVGRGASCVGGSRRVSVGGLRGIENAGMSNEWRVRIPSAD